MKVTQQPTVPKFEPITIVLETEEEAEIMWGILDNCNNWPRYTRRNTYLSTRVHMWQAYRALYVY